MTIERPMFPPRAESVDSFSPQPAVRQPESQTLTSDSPGPAESPATADVIQFPGRAPPSEGFSDEYIANLHSEAFRDLETSLCDCVTMGKIAAQCMGEAKCQDELLAFSVFNLSRMLDALKAEYEARWHGERRG